jgi:antitoxin CptB
MEQLRWACRRGMLELDIILNDFLDNQYPVLSEKLQMSFGHLLSCTDQELFRWLVHHEIPSHSSHFEITHLIKHYASRIV